ncbi:serine/threonine-protein kinase pelle-like isoform X2 [Daphnia carinata]|uniref:serine/threonine-protein kinase pelle-like isoform X2 n=1 Tax=Daphnia carinata TaxID=120202 RepID=UPI002868F887|nr:serine/threonine-protein kinase pelle-like isoform X2 [Daphnia carinata]
MAWASPKPKYIYQLPYIPQRDLALILDDNNQWKELGDFMQYNVTRLNEFGRNLQSPTLAMFSDWGQKNHTVVELFVLLSKMQHYRALEILMPYVDESYHVLYRNGELNLSKLLKTELSGGLGSNSEAAAATSPNGAKGSVDSCNFNSPVSERAFPSKLAVFEIGQPTTSSSKPIPINQGDLTRSENIQASWNPVSPAQVPNPSPQHGPINGTLPRRDSESSAFSDASSASAMSNIPPIDEHELAIATNFWNAVSILGKGGFGTVYKGTWKNTQVAIKRMENKGLAGANLIPMQQSMGELRILNAVRHDNILPLYGYSLGGDYPCLVYQFMPNGSLEDRLLCRQNTYPLNWEQRFNIARGTARGLQFLHTMGDKPLIHGDIKSANILLDKNFEPKIGDFGLAREGPQTHYTHIKVSRVLGTRPYLPDEYLRGKKISTKVDTYSFGIVLFELGTGLRAYDNHREHPYLRDQIENGGQTDLRDVKAGQVCVALYQPLMHLGWLCASAKAKERPEMVKVLQDLDHLASGTEVYIRQSTARPPRAVDTPPVRLAREKEIEFLSQTPRDKEISFLPPTSRDKVVPFLLPSPAPQIEASAEPFPVPRMNYAPGIEIVQPNAIPSPAVMVNEHEIIPAFDQLVVSRDVSTGLCSVASDEIPNFNSLLNVESSSQTVNDDRTKSSSGDSSETSSDSTDESETQDRHSNI